MTVLDVISHPGTAFIVAGCCLLAAVWLLRKS